jgi:hypothetical protein
MLLTVTIREERVDLKAVVFLHAAKFFISRHCE